MYYYKNTFRFLLAVILFAGCSKSSVSVSPLASLNVVDASVNVATIKANFTGTGLPNFYATNTVTVAYGANNVYGVNAGVTVPLTIINNADSTKAIYQSNLNLVNGGIYSLYLAGQSTAVDTIFVKETIPSYTDSSCGVRFINLSYNSNPIIVTQSATPTVVDFTSLSYKSYSSFKTYPALAANATYTFQVRDAGTNAILATYALTTPRFFNCTLAWIGQTGVTGTNAPKIARINNY